MRRYVVFVAAVLALLLLGARSGAPVLPPSVQPAFQRILVAVNQEHELGADARITDISIQKRRVQLELEIGGRKLRLVLVHRGAQPTGMRCRYFGFSYDDGEWSGHRAQLGKLAKLIDKQFAATPWFVPVARQRPSGLLERWQNLALSSGLAMTLLASSLLVGLMGVALLLWRRRGRHERQAPQSRGTARTGSAPGKARKASAGWKVFAAVTLLSLVWLLLVSHAPGLTADTSRDLLFARDCHELGRCMTLGAKTSYSEWYQGGTWTQLIAAIEFLGGGVRALQGTVIALQALSCGLWYVFLSRYFAGFMPVLASLFWLGALCFIGDHSLLWNPSGVALPVVLASAGLLVFAATGRLLALCVAVFWTGLGMGFHVDCATLLPVEFASAALVARRAWLAELAVLCALLLGMLPTSLEAARANLAFVVGSGAVAPVLAGVFALLLVPRLMRARFWRAGREARCAWLAGGAVVPLLLGLGWLALHGHYVAMRYAYPALPVALAAVAVPIDVACRRMARSSRRPAAGALLAGAAGSLWLWTAVDRSDPVQPSRWTSADARAVAARLSATGYSYEAARWHLQGPHTWELITAIAPFLPQPKTSRPALEKPDLLVLRPPPRDATAGSLIHPAGRPPLYVRSIRPWLHIAGGRVCVLPGRAGRNVEAHCQDLPADVERPEGFRFRFRGHPRLYNTSERPPYLVRFVVPVRPAGSDSRRFVQVLLRSRRCPWRIAGVEGISYQGRLPARRIVLEHGRGGHISFTRRYAADCGPELHYMRPSIVETHPGEAELRRALEGY